MVAIAHALVQTIATDPAATAAGKITPDAWNAEHSIQVTGADVVLGAQTPGDAQELTLTQVLDFIGSPTQGDILFRSSAGWVRLPIGLAGLFLQSQGVAEDLVWGQAAVLSNSQTWAKAQSSLPATLVDSGATVTVDLSRSNEFIFTLVGNTTLLNAINPTIGQSGSIKITNAASGGPFTMAFGTTWVFPSPDGVTRTIPALTAVAGACDTLYYSVRSATKIEAVLAKGFL